MRLAPMRLNSTPPDDSFQIRCPRLGQQIHFAYCRQENMGLPCARSLDCWFMHFDVVTHLRDELSAGEWEEAFEKPSTPKILSLAELIDRALKQQKEQK